MGEATPKRYALAFGAAHYTHEELPALPGVAEDLPSILRSLAGIGYEPMPVFPDGKLDPPAPDDVLRPLLRWLTNDFQDGDTLLVYYSGHGQEEGPAHYLMCSDSEPGPAEVRLSALAAHQLVELPALKGVQRLLLVIDACYAGRGAVDAMGQAVRAKLTLAHAPGADHRFLKSFGVLSAARITEEAHDGAFSAALAHVLTDEARLGHHASHISLPELVAALNAEFRRREVDQKADWAQLFDDTIQGDPATGFFPNPYYVPELRLAGRELDIAEQRHFVRSLGTASAFEIAEQRRRYADLSEHFSPRGTGRQTATEIGHYFTGRARALRRLAGWLRGQNDHDARVFVVTGPPGVGKSAVLGRLVALSDEGTRDTIPADTVAPGTQPPTGAITVALHARALTLDQVVAALAAAVGAPEPTVSGLRERLASLDSFATFVVDALDESGVAHDEERHIARFLADLADAFPRLRLLIGTRPHIVGAIAWRAPQARLMDLAEPAWTDIEDLVTYSEHLLRAPLGPNSGRNLPDSFVARAAGEIALTAHPLYLVARLIARATANAAAGHSASPLSLPAPDPSDSPATAIGRAFRWALTQQLALSEAAEVKSLLLPLAYAEGQGMPLPHIWAALAAPHPHQTGPTAERILNLLRNDAVGPYLVETLDEDGRSVYRLYHQALADDLRRHDSPRDAEDRWYRRLRGTVPRATDGTLSWREADAYVLRHLPAKAAAAGRLDELVTDGEFLIHAHPSGLAPLLHGLRTDEARSAAAVYRDHLDLHRRTSPEDRRHILACDAARHRHTALLDQLNTGGRADRWRPLWAAAGSSRSTLSVQRLADGLGPITAASRIGGDIVVAADGGKLRAWAMATGRPVDLPTPACSTAFTSLTTTTSAGHDLLITGTATGAVHVYDITTACTREASRLAPVDSSPVTHLVTLDLGGRRIAVSATQDGVQQVWDLANATALPHRLLLPDGCPGGLATVTVDADLDAADKVGRRGREVVVAGGRHGSLHIWDLARGKTAASPADPRLPPLDAVGCAVLHGVPVAVTADRNAVRIWSLRRLRAPREVDALVLPSPATAVSCTTPGGRPTAVLACVDGSVHMLDLESRRLVASSAPRQPTDATTSSPSGLQRSFTSLHTYVSGDGAATAVLGTPDGSVRVCDLTPPPGTSNDGHTRAIVAAACASHRGQPVVVTAGSDTTIRIWRMDTGALALPPITDEVSGFTGVVSATVDGRTLALTLAANRPAEVWDLTSGTTMDRQRPRWGMAVAVGHDKGRPVAVMVDYTHRLQVWDMISGTSLHDLTRAVGRVTALACAPQGGPLDVAAVRSDGSVGLWRLGTNDPGKTLRGTWTATAVACVRTGERSVALIACDDGTVRAWDGLTDIVLGEQEPGIKTLTGRIVKGRLLLATGNSAGQVTVWETDGKVWPLASPDPAVDMFTVPDQVAINALEFAPDGRLILSAYKDVYVFGTADKEERDSADSGASSQADGMGGH
ncbi:caspase family protein [Streptomyces sp. NPDC056930]|uniref:caspase family protein n=1 Tax=Streptomyces sp. NPDC056930 TaxID=3345967 RepID=UPI00362E6579